MTETEIENVVAGLVEQAERRFYGKYRGIVADNEDPAGIGRLKVKVPSVLGPDVVTGWATPCLPYGGAADQGLVFVPERQAHVWVEFEEGDLEFPIWVGVYWNMGDMPEPATVGPRPTKKIVRTVKGHTLEFEDADGKESVILREGGQGHTVTMDNDGIKITDATGNAVELTRTEMNLIAKTPLTINAAGMPVKIICSALALVRG
ncbi:phage baseplate assembly protein V [Nonomuraea spiralis]|uniref:Phage baseplate assembly protein V n=1 Tax=Nonomuraea spiralis TaxID=46182 RepID=A0ABV5IRZ3_9ACTN|nr:phage baseplate assembly protein V [Nonomuraea spiralis]GGT11664.1 baseplate assembly protein [Nonomuraea spiralis]